MRAASGQLDKASVVILPTGIAALLAALDRGPLVRRLVDDLTLSWTREGTRVRFLLSSRFLLQPTGLRWYAEA
jgi:hypothetical protein